jgi:hypothetical protein
VRASGALDEMMVVSLEHAPPSSSSSIVSSSSSCSSSSCSLVGRCFSRVLLLARREVARAS